jgi:uncharacterized protein HemX
MTGNQQFVVQMVFALGVAVPSIIAAWQTRKIRVHQELNAKQNNEDNFELKQIGAALVENTNGITDKLIVENRISARAEGKLEGRAEEHAEEIVRQKETL